jgi:biotin operon repressor
MITDAAIAIFARHIGQALINAAKEIEVNQAQPPRKQPAPEQKHYIDITQVPLTVEPNLKTVKETGVWARFSAAENVDKLRRLAPNNSPEQLAAILGFTPKQVKNYASLLRKKAGIDIPRFKSTGRGYSTKSQRIDEIIKEHIDTMTYAEIAYRIGFELKASVSEKAIQNRADKMGLVARRNKEWEAEREVIIRNNHGKVPVAELAAMVKMSVSGLEKIINKLGIAKWPHKAAPAMTAKPKSEPRPVKPVKIIEQEYAPPTANATKWNENTDVIMPDGRTIKALAHQVKKGSVFYGPPINHPDFGNWLLKKVAYLVKIGIKPEEMSEQYLNEYQKLKAA